MGSAPTVSQALKRKPDLCTGRGSNGRGGKIPLDEFPTLVYTEKWDVNGQNRSRDMETRSTDAKGRISLPKAFANATVIIDQVSDSEIRIRKAIVIPEDEVKFY